MHDWLRWCTAAAVRAASFAVSESTLATGRALRQAPLRYTQSSHTVLTRYSHSADAGCRRYCGEHRWACELLPPAASAAAADAGTGARALHVPKVRRSSNG